MCGIVGYIGNEEAVPVLLNGLAKLEYRGYDSAGISVYKDGIRTIKAKGRLANLSDKIQGEGSVSSHMGIGHTRWATHGAPSDRNSHPHNSQSGKVSVVHNGIIENYMEIKDFLLDKGYHFVSETDTEVVAQLFDFYYDGDPVGTLRKIIGRLRGAYALGIMCNDHPDRLIAVRKDSPLLVGLSQEGNYIASDIPALLEYTRDYYLLNDNEIVFLTKDGVTLYDLDGNQIHKDVFHVTWDIDAAEKGGYDYFMMKEIMEQPEALRKTLFPRMVEQGIALEDLSLTEEEIKHFNRIHIVACGSAWHAGIVGRYVMEEVSRIPVEVDIASEFRYRNPILHKNDLCVIISQSGETADTLAALREAKKQGVKVLSIVNVVGSSIARESDDVLYTWAGPEIAVATTKGYTTQLSMLYLVALHFAKVRGTIGEESLREYLKELHMLPEKTEEILKLDGQMENLAKKYAQSENAFIIGRGLDYAAAMESSLKLKEISYIHSEAYAAGELKHGTISLIEEGTLVIAIATQERLFEKLVSNVKEVKARGANVIAIATEGNLAMEEVADEVIYLPKSADIFTSSYNVLPMQLFAYYTAVERGCDVDKPRNLAKSVTVE
ncbi:glutamine--fructose-6-phosphate transaminase (isomerizing) [Anaerotignum sp. MB30-C6]|uniref:glutamine--fructose-6-phosphate transaminase (isomerizing) n=1 Tax=Anaerotignum sp. MB30-C6 TaxID=3070814 RepID=UPI0027DE7309|nr:glutamine--fructose-6-phosphate transaminase (isomerizing) [Anaerotignum sp. MB30-C6]WMI80762.1 glutamine--fructose-6-phosphate transaminase (isomerizing) [Anaerotignum sp. MB30-C6]